MTKTRKVNTPKNFMGAGAKVASNDSGRVPGEHMGMGFNYGRGYRNPMGKMRGDSIGYRPVSKKQLGSAPRQIV